MEKETSLHFSIDGQWLADFSRTRVREGDYQHALRILDCLDGMGMDDKIAIFDTVDAHFSEEWLAKVLEGYSCQTEQNFEIVIADDGSTLKTKEVITSFSSKNFFISFVAIPEEFDICVYI